MTDWQIRHFREGDAAKIAEGWTTAFAADDLEFVGTGNEICHRSPDSRAGRRGVSSEEGSHGSPKTKVSSRFGKDA